ncbi:ABC transporter substrate-binding protein [Aquincola sp. S2]|uniref:ABC transporter substrate-binding protein n=1 Tax=Pseudaquabacterium terrae TaxID=2732868 RepID=A0ABX2EHP7_9BURK|nr:ABC transporter substrate-binding protein [Aquabacterium terrae]NRF68150.1 ABC transporter substrate-binding protein [Aquabacterium terrae]
MTMFRRSLLAGLGGVTGLAALGPLHAATLTGSGGGAVVRLGQSASLSGGQQRYGQDVRAGILAALQAANRAESQRDGPRALQFELQTLDDGGVRDRGVANVKQLIDDGAAALVGLTSGAIAEAALPLVQNAQIPLLGTASGNMGIRLASAAGISHVRAGYDTEYRRMVAYVRDFGMKRVGYVHLQDTSKANLEAMQQALQAARVQPAVTVGVDRNAKSFAPQVQQLAAAKLDGLMFTTNAGPILRMVEELSAAGFNGMCFASSFAGQELVDGIALAGRSIVMSLVVPRPNALGLAVVNQCRQDLAAFGGGAKLGITTLEGYIAGRVAVDAARAAQRGGKPTRASMRDALARLQTDLGGYRVNFGAEHGMHGSQYVDMVVINRHGHIVG